MPEYNEQNEVMRYVWRNYPDIVRPHECIPSHARIRDALPRATQDEYTQHVGTTERCLARIEAERQSLPTDDSVVDISLRTPAMRPELLAEVMRVIRDLEVAMFLDRVRPHEHRISVNRCGKCSRVLINAMSRQCLWCSYDWH